MINDKPVIFFEDGIPKTTSREVARIFGKAHKDVLRAIRNPIIPADFSGRNFATNKIRVLNSQSGEEVGSVTMTRDGFNLIAMGFTGSRAMQHKIDFIYAFNAVVDELARVKLQGPAPQPQIETAEQQEVRPGLQPLYHCAHCREWLPSGAFNRDNARNPPRQSWCRQCHKDRSGEMKMIGWTPELREIITAPAVPESVPSPPQTVVPDRLHFIPGKVLALVRHNPPKSNQRRIPEAELTEDKITIRQLINSNRELLNYIEERTLGADPNAKT